MGTPTCESCGARIEPSHLTCPYCSAVTPFGVQRREHDEYARRVNEANAAAAAQQSAFHGRAVAQGEVERIAHQSMIWSVVGFVLCCLPVPSLVSLVLAYRAYAVSRAKGFVFPAQATVGLLLSVVTLLSSASFYVFAGVTAVQKHQRIRALEAATATKAAAETLDHDTACQLVEIQLLSHGFSSSSDNISDLKCDGAIEQHGSLATLHDVTFDVENAFHTSDASFKRGARWMVEHVTDVSSHATPASTATAPAGPSPSALVGAKGIPSAHVAAPHHDAGAPKPR